MDEDCSSCQHRSGAAPIPQDAFEPFAEGEWGPTGTYERHRVVAMGVFEMPWGIQLSPVFQAATARPRDSGSRPGC